jgi:VanZ family protein
VQAFLKYNIRAVLWGVLIIVITVIPGQVIPGIPVFLDLFKPDKLIHVFIFAVYVFLQIGGLTRQETYLFPRRHAVKVTLAIALILAAGTEVLQAYVIPMRNGNALDFLANAAGCAAGWGWYHFRSRKKS